MHTEVDANEGSLSLVIGEIILDLWLPRLRVVRPRLPKAMLQVLVVG